MSATWIELASMDGDARARLLLGQLGAELLIGTFESSIIVGATLRELLRLISLPIRCPFGPLRLDLVGESGIVGIRAKTSGQVTVSFNQNQIVCDPLELICDLHRSTEQLVDYLKDADRIASELGAVTAEVRKLSKTTAKR